MHEIRAIETPHAPQLSFVIPIEPDWVTAMPTHQSDSGRGRPVAMALFATDTAMKGARIVVSTQTLPCAVDPLEWIRYMWATSGWKIVVARTHPASGGPRYELGAMRTRNGEPEVRRTLVLRTGARLLRADACTSLREWPNSHDSLWWSLDGFALGAPSKLSSIEALTPCQGPLLRFAIPQSWHAAGTGTHFDGVRWAANPVRDVQRGVLLQVIASPELETVSASQRRAIYAKHARAHQTVGALLPTQRPTLAQHVRGWLGQWQAATRTTQGDGVLVVVQREVEGVAIDYVLQAPAAGTQHLDWMRATRALDIAISTTVTRSPRTQTRTPTRTPTRTGSDVSAA